MFTPPGVEVSALKNFKRPSGRRASQWPQSRVCRLFHLQISLCSSSTPKVFPQLYSFHFVPFHSQRSYYHRHAPRPALTNVYSSSGLRLLHYKRTVFIFTHQVRSKHCFHILSASLQRATNLCDVTFPFSIFIIIKYQ